MIYRLFVVCAIGSLLAISPAPKTLAADDSQQRIHELEVENDLLRQELARLRLELSQLKQQLAAAKDHSPPANDALADEGIDRPEDSGDVRDSPESPATEKPDANAFQPRTYRNADEIYRAIPQRLSPIRGGWTITQKKEVLEWLSGNIPGNRYDSVKTISSYSIRTHPQDRDAWQISIQFEPETMRYMGWLMNEKISVLVIDADAEKVDNAAKLFRKGTRLRILGNISKLDWDMVGERTGEVWRPKHCTIYLVDTEYK